jgi:RNA polymerase sigma-70 factor, ECF subfamily
MTLEREGPGSFESFFRQHYGPIVRALVIVSGSETEAEDLAQEAFARALEHWNRVGAMESPVGYVYRTAFNVHRNRIRHMVRALRRRSEPPPIDSDPSSEVEMRYQVRRVLGQLPAGQREALVLVGWLGLDAEEAGRVLGITAASVRGRVHRARQRIDQPLGGDDV